MKYYAAIIAMAITPSSARMGNLFRAQRNLAECLPDDVCGDGYAVTNTLAQCGGDCVPDVRDDGAYCVDIITAQNVQAPTGKACYKIEGDNMVIDLENSIAFEEIHLYVGPKDGVPRNSKNTPVPGDFPWSFKPADTFTSHTFEIPLCQIDGGQCCSGAKETNFHLFLHGADVEKETSWAGKAGCPTFDSLGTTRWGFFSEVCMDCCGFDGECALAEMMTIGLNEALPAVSTDPLEVFDFTDPDLLCDLTMTVETGDMEISPSGCYGEKLRTYTITDGVTTRTCSQKLKVILDDEPPKAVKIPTATFEAPLLDSKEVDCEMPTITDNCAMDLGEPKIVLADKPDDVKDLGCGAKTITRFYTLTDAAGNTQEISQEIVVEDTTAPEIMIPEDATVTCAAGANMAFGEPEVKDDCDMDAKILDFVDEVVESKCGLAGIYKRTWTATDCAGNTAKKSQTITVVDVEKPSLTSLPGKTVVEFGTALDWATPEGSDACGDVKVSFDEIYEPGCTGEMGIYKRVWKAVDECGIESETVEQIIEVVDTTPPVVTAPEDITMSCSPGVDKAFGEPLVVDECDKDPSMLGFVDEVIESKCGLAGVYMRTWTATDCSGNTASASQRITVIDDSKPVLSSLPEKATIEYGNELAWVTPEGSDTCGGVELAFVDSFEPGCNGKMGIHKRVWTATDDCGLESLPVEQVIETVDTTPPEIDAPPDMIIECKNAANMEFGEPVVLDGCDKAAAIRGFVDEVMEEQCGLTGVFKRTWTATDCSGNEATASQVITVVDTTKPTLTGLPAKATVEYGSDLEWDTPVGDDVCGEVVLTFEEAFEPSCGKTGVTKRVWVATDSCNNKSDPVEQLIETVDTTPPALNCGDVLINYMSCSDGVMPPDLQCTATDEAGDVTILDKECCFVKEQASFTRTYKAVDECGNEAEVVELVPISEECL